MKIEPDVGIAHCDGRRYPSLWSVIVSLFGTRA